MNEYQIMKDILNPSEEFETEYYAEYYDNPDILQTCGFYYDGVLFVFDKATGKFIYSTRNY